MIHQITSSSLSQPVTPVTEMAAMDAIDRMFAEFELVYHNQYQKAFSTKEKEDLAKRVWYSHLKEYSVKQIFDASHSVIRESEYLPTVHSVIAHIEKPVVLFSSLPHLSDPMSREEKLAALAKLRQDTGL